MGENSSESAPLVKRTLTDPRPPRRPFIAGLFLRHILGEFAFIGSRDEGHRTSRIEERPHTRRQLRGGENREKSGGQIKWLSTSYSTGGLHLFSAAMGPDVSGPPLSEALWATRICPVIHYRSPERRWAQRRRWWRRKGGEWQWWQNTRRTPAETRWLANQEKKKEKRKNTPGTPHPSPTQKPERRQMRRIKKR